METTEGWDKTSSAASLLTLLVVLAGAALYLVGLGATPLQCGNETMYAFPPIEMLETHDYLVPHYNHGPFLVKPPLTFWIVAATYRILGVTIATSRLPGAAAGLATILAVALWVRKRAGARAALFSACALMFSFKFVVFSRQYSSLDALLTLAVTLAVIAVDAAVRREGGSDVRAGVQAGGALALAFGFKGLIGVILPLGAVATGLLLDRRRPVRPWRRGTIAAGVLVAAILPWHVAMTARFGLEFWREFYWSNQFVRATTETFMIAERGPLYYVAFFAWAAFPWILFAPGGFLRRRGTAAPLGWLLFGAAFLSAITMKREVYAMPIMPAAAILAGETLDDAVGRRRPGVRFAWALAAVVAAAALAAWLVLNPPVARLVGPSAPLFLGLGIAALLAAALFAAARPRSALATPLAGAACGLLFFAVLHLESRTTPYDPMPAFGERVRALCLGECTEIRVDIPCTSLEYYSRWEWIDLEEPWQLLGQVPAGGAFAIVRSSDEETLTQLGVHYRVLERRPWMERNWASAARSGDRSPFESLSLLRLEPSAGLPDVWADDAEALAGGAAAP